LTEITGEAKTAQEVGGKPRSNTCSL